MCFHQGTNIIEFNPTPVSQGPEHPSSPLLAELVSFFNVIYALVVGVDMVYTSSTYRYMYFGLALVEGGTRHLPPIARASLP